MCMMSLYFYNEYTVIFCVKEISKLTATGSLETWTFL
jgi:hypothetical protein